jgi:Stage II sporulation protein M
MTRDMKVRAEQMAVVQGWDDTKAALRAWRAAPSTVLRPWLVGSLLTALLLLLATWVIAELSTPDLSPYGFPGVTTPVGVDDYGFVLFRNSLVLALHSLACVAGFIAGSSLPQIAGGYSGIVRRAHELARPLAIGFVVAATLFSLVTQAWILGHDTATIAHNYGLSPAELLSILSLHALPELTALFLPLAAWTMASRRKQWEDLLAATFATLIVSVPLVLAAAAVEVWVTPRVLIAAIG